MENAGAKEVKSEDVVAEGEVNGVEDEAKNEGEPGENSISPESARKKLFQESADLRILCEINGISEKKFSNTPEKFEHIDLFMCGSATIMNEIRHFPHAKSICLMKLPNLREMTGLEGMSQLTSLWVTECKVETIECLENCSRLENLHLSGNRITHLNHKLSSLTSLQLLWLNDNKLTSLKGLGALPHLRVLWACRNRIAALADAFRPLQALEELNLADNKIGCFKQLLNLTNCSALRSLSLSDPHFGDNPVCALCNYDTYATFHLPQLTSLDMEALTEDAKSLCQAIYMKKKMYYNMRTKMVKRHAGQALARAVGVLEQTAQATARPLLRRLQRETKGLSVRLDEWQYLENADVEEATIQQYQDKLERCNGCMEEVRAYRAGLGALLDAFSRRLSALSAACVAKLMVEFDTGGNVRLEEGSPADVWHASCGDLCQNRYHPTTGLDAEGFPRIEVRRVIRVHNRFMRYRLEHFMLEVLRREKKDGKKKKKERAAGEADSMGGSSKGSTPKGGGGGAAGSAKGGSGTVGGGAGGAGGAEARRNMEYLFFLGEGAYPGRNYNWGLGVAEDGFPSIPGRGIALSSSIPGPSQVPGGGKSPEHAGGSTMWPSGQALIVKTYIGNNLHFPDDHDIEDKIEEAKSQGYQTISVGEGPGINFKWYVWDPALLLPEYVVDYEYLSPVEDALGRRPSVQRAWELLQAQLLPPKAQGLSSKEVWRSRELVDMLPYLPHLKRFLKQIAVLGEEAAEGGPLEERSSAALQRAPQVSGREAAIYLLTKDALLAYKNTQDPNRITYLNLHGQALRKLEKIGYFPNLEYLILSFNEITSLSGLGGSESAPKLKYLDLSHNSIQVFHDLEADCTPEGLLGLKTCLMQGNLLSKSSLSHLELFARYMPHLDRLDLQDNAICKARSYRASILRSCINLTMLDGVEITSEERTNVQLKAALTHDLIYQCYVQRSQYGDMPVSPKGHASVAESFSNSNGSLLQAPNDSSWIEKVEKLDLSHNHIQVISSLEDFINLKKVSFARNDISVIQGLNHNRNLEEINFEGNEITSISNLHGNTRLRRLDLGLNQIQNISNLGCLSSLSQLSLESNHIDNLEGLSDLSCLMELYMGNNKISNINQIHHLKALPKLIILDLSGNPISSESTYRLYTLYNLKRLKVLDGLSIHTSELAQARERYSGRLTDQMLVDVLGHTSFHIVRELELLNQKIRDVSVLCDMDFSGLVAIDLTRNLLTEYGDIGRLPALQSLCMNENKIESMFKRPKGGSSNPSDVGPEEPIFPNLKTLRLAANRISDMTALQLWRLPVLTHLDLQSNSIPQITGMNECTALKELILDKNKIRQLQDNCLAGLISLRKFKMQENGLKSLVNFKNLPALRYLNLASNRITDLGELDKLAQIGKLADLSLANNPVARKLAYKPSLLYLFTTLQYIDGEEVDYGERERAEMMFLANDRPVVNYAGDARQNSGYGAAGYPQNGQGISGTKVPVKLTSVNFEALSVAGGAMEDAGGGVPGGGGGHFQQGYPPQQQGQDPRAQYFPPAGKRRY